MYRPAKFREDRPQVLKAFITEHPLGALIVATPAGLVANHIPMLIEETAGVQRLRGHLARANDLWRNVADGTPVLVIFGGADRYITPSWYATKQRSGEVVPTWNYAVVHAHGTIRFTERGDVLRPLVETLTDHHEAGREQPWAVADAPEPYIEGMLKAIVGFDIVISRLEGKFKSSQNRDAADRDGVRRGLAEAGLSEAERDELIRPG